MIKITPEQMKITMTDSAIAQILLILKNDFTIEDQVFRLKVDGKGCGGFDYALGFTESQNDDLKLNFTSDKGEVQIAIDPFTAFYSQEGVIDFVSDYQNDIEGFSFENNNESKYRGKFFKNEELLPEFE